VTAKSDAETRRLIRRAQRANPIAPVVVTGCYAQLAAEALLEIPGVSLVLGNSEKRNIASFIRAMEEKPRSIVADISKAPIGSGVVLESFAEHTRAFLQVQNGCDARCSYCIVPFARGASRSVAPEEALQGMTTFTDKGFKEIVLTGIHLGAYGLDLNPATDLLGLLTLAKESSVVKRVRIGSLEPAELTPDLLNFISRSTMVCPHLHLPLQSGSDSVLSRMDRGYSTSFYRDLLEKVVQAIPQVNLGCDLIAGFPGESEEEFTQTLNFVESLPLSYLHVFPFSKRPGTPAATMTGQLDSRTIKERADALRAVSAVKARAFAERFIGEELQVLVQRGGRKGLSRNYLPVLVEGGEGLFNTEVTVLITGRNGAELTGRLRRV
jgi:threonylcarbamoyladenosine tRNA methylthiotransferase MtaB